MELHAAIEHVIASTPRRVINVGCSGGYYGVGFARRIPSAHVIAFDIDALARETCIRAALENRVASRVDVRAACTPSTLEELAGPGTVIFSDCEGYELQLLDPDVVPALRETAIVVELHDVWVPNLAPRLLARFTQTHDISHIAMVPRTASRYPILKEAGLSDSEMSLAVSDFRPQGMTWAYMVPRSA
jgi:ribosomal protein L11 methylase PrmA